MEKNITPINQLSWKDRLKSYKKHPGSFILLLLVGASAVITVTVLVYLVGYILIHGVPYLRPSLFSLTYNSDNVSMMPAIINTITMVLLALLFSVPFGIGAAIYLVEYAKKGNKLVELVLHHSRDSDGYSFYYIWTFWYVVFRDSVALGIFHVSWCGNACDHGAPGYYANDRGGTFVCAGYVP